MYITYETDTHIRIRIDICVYNASNWTKEQMRKQARYNKASKKKKQFNLLGILYSSRMYLCWLGECLCKMFYSSIRHRIHYYKMMIPVRPMAYGPTVVPTTWTQMRFNNIDRKAVCTHLETIRLWILWVLLNLYILVELCHADRPQKRRKKMLTAMMMMKRRQIQERKKLFAIDYKMVQSHGDNERFRKWHCNLINHSWKNREHKKRICLMLFNMK